jgi:hypothetical protein
MTLLVAPAGVGHRRAWSWRRGLGDSVATQLQRVEVGRNNRADTNRYTIARRCRPCRKDRTRWGEIGLPVRYPQKSACS